MAQYSNNCEQCATCAYWGGNRQTDTFRQRVDVGSAMTTGTCLNRNSPWSNTQRQANSYCNCFEKWPVLK